MSADQAMKSHAPQTRIMPA